MGPQRSVTGLHTMDLTTELTADTAAVTELGANRLWAAGVAGGVRMMLATGQSAMSCWLSQYTQYSSMELGLVWEQQRGRNIMKSGREGRNKLNFEDNYRLNAALCCATGTQQLVLDILEGTVYTERV